MNAPLKIAVAGATGRLGVPLVSVLAERGYTVVPIARATGVDVITGAGLAAALEGVDVVVDAATGPSPEQQAATEFFTTAARNLQTVAAAAGVQQMIVVSIIGTDRFTAGYGAAKIAHEQATLAGPVPARVVRASQFHEFVGQLLDWGTRDGVGHVADMRTQLVAARAVAEAIADLVTEIPATTMVEVAGPREERLADAARLLAQRRGHPARVEEGLDPSDPDAELGATGALLPGPHAIRCGPTFAEWLDANVDVPA